MSSVRFIDIGVNLTDPVYRGLYHGKQKHKDDFALVMERARSAGVQSMIITGTSVKESKRALTLASELGCYTTVGCHPTRSNEFEAHPQGPEGYFSELDALIASDQGKGRVVAIGECGLDYDRLHFSPIEVQKKYFHVQLALAKKYSLPLFLHSRAAHADFVEILKKEGFGVDGGKAVGGRGGVVHSFTGAAAEVAELVEMGFHLSVNGCGLKTPENLEGVKAIPIERLMLETDAPWCSLRPTHASWVHLESMPENLGSIHLPRPVKPEKYKEGSTVAGRNEPAAIGGVAWVMHSLLGVALEELTEQVWKNTVEVFGLDVKEGSQETSK